MSSHDSSTDPPPRWTLDAVFPDGVRPRTREEAPDDQPHPVDQVAIRKLGGFNVITPDQWQELDRDHRLALLRDGLVTFLYQGEDVPLKAALLGLKAATRPEAPLPPWPPPTRPAREEVAGPVAPAADPAEVDLGQVRPRLRGDAPAPRGRDDGHPTTTREQP